MGRVAFLLVVLAAWAPLPHAPADPCTLCSGSKEVGCPTCNGTGRARVECSGCRGAGRMPCLTCRTGEQARIDKAPKPPRGMLPCPNETCDKKGMVTWVSGKSGAAKDRDPCKVCDGKGSYKCPTCTDAMAPCVLCAGKGRLEGACPDCAGSKKLPCPGCSVKPKSSSCPFCHDERKRACELCKPGGGPPEAGAKVKCLGCAGVGMLACTECRGLGRNPCAGCGGTGLTRLETAGTGDKAGKKSHDACKGVGWTKCEFCKSGRTDCKRCTNGDVPVRCSGCRDSKIVKCHGCFPRWTAFEICGRILHEKSRFDEAAAFYAAALSRVMDPLNAEKAADPAAQRVVDEWFKATRTRLEAAATAADEKRAPPSAGK